MDTNKLKEQVRSIPIPAELRQRSKLGIEQAHFEQQEMSHRRMQSSRKRILAAVIVGFIVVTTAAMNHTKVWAAIQKALQYVPGIGILTEGKASQVRYFLEQPIVLKVGEGSLTITGILSTEEMTYITMTGVNSSSPDHVTLVNEQGDEYRIESSGSTNAGNKWWVPYWHKGELDLKGESVLILDADPPIKIPIQLMDAESYYNSQDINPTVTVNGLPITMFASRAGDKARVILVTSPTSEYQIADYGILGVYLHDEHLRLNIKDSRGEQLEIEPISTMSSTLSELFFPLSDNENDHYTLTIPEISIEYPDEVSVWISTEAQDNMNQSFEIAGYPVTITRIEKIANDALRMYVDLHYDEQDQTSLYGFTIDNVGSTRSLLDEETGTVKYIEFGIEADQQLVKLKFARPTVVMRGPWTFNLPVKDFSPPEVQ